MLNLKIHLLHDTLSRRAFFAKLEQQNSQLYIALSNMYKESNLHRAQMANQIGIRGLASRNQICAVALTSPSPFHKTRYEMKASNEKYKGGWQ